MLNFGELNVVVSIIFKILRECNWTNKRQILDIRENNFQGNDLQPFAWKKA